MTPLIWIRIRGSMPLTNGSGCGSGSFYFHHWPSRCHQKTNFKKSFSAYYFLKVLFTSFFKKVKKKSQNSRNQDFSYYFCLMIEGSGSRRPKNTWIRWIRIRIRNTGFQRDRRGEGWLGSWLTSQLHGEYTTTLLGEGNIEFTTVCGALNLFLNIL